MFVELAGITSGDVPGTLDQCSMMSVSTPACINGVMYL